MGKGSNAEKLIKAQEEQEQKVDKLFMDEYTALSKKYSRDIGAELVYGKGAIRAVPGVMRIREENKAEVKK